MTMPTPASNMHIASVDYVVSFSQLVSPTAPIRFSAPAATRYTFTFDTGETDNADGSVTVTSSQAWFNQAQAEGAIASTLDGICTDLATLLGLTQAQVQAAVIIRRTWTYNENSYTPIPGVTSGSQMSTWVDVMTYPVPAAPAA